MMDDATKERMALIIKRLSQNKYLLERDSKLVLKYVDTLNDMEFASLISWCLHRKIYKTPTELFSKRPTLLVAEIILNEFLNSRPEVDAPIYFWKLLKRLKYKDQAKRLEPYVEEFRINQRSRHYDRYVDEPSEVVPPVEKQDQS